MAIDGSKVVGMEELRGIIAKRKVGAKLRVTFVRERDTFEVYVVLKASP